MKLPPNNCILLENNNLAFHGLRRIASTVIIRSKHLPYPTSLAFIFHATKDHDFRKHPILMRTPIGKHNVTKYCDYHQYVEHHTDNCKALRDFIRRLMAYDYQQEYATHHQRARHNSPNKRRTSRNVPMQKITLA